MYRCALHFIYQIPQAYLELPSLNDPIAAIDRLHRL